MERETFDLSVKNPNAPEEDPLREPWEILEEIAALDAESAEILAGIGGMAGLDSPSTSSGQRAQPA
ncbi:hypothetical protein [Lusitaniella coriacea]|uniref:hypothetical protein n=1 Tax=Lusitaniella coriacea TaxID=1983105 RepID=UPI00188000DC|nr:hypothetical protein [Lusitaniella coriacea]